MSRVNKKEMSKRVAAATEIPTKTAEQVLTILFDTIKESLKQGETCRVHGLGTFSVKDVPARQGRNPRSGETIQIPEKRKVVFKPAANLKKAL